MNIFEKSLAMFQPEQIDPWGGPTPPIVQQAAQSWICCLCGLRRAYEGGRRIGGDDRNECRECGAPLAAKPGDGATMAACSARRGSVHVLIDRDLF